MKTFKTIFVVSLLVTLLIACKKNDSLTPESIGTLVPYPINTPPPTIAYEQLYPIWTQTALAFTPPPNPYPAPIETSLPMATAQALLPTRTLTVTQTTSDLPADPQEFTFLSSDQTSLAGIFYPSKYSNSPLVILMHQAGSNKESWSPFALWLQNWAAQGSTGSKLASLSLNQTIFPPLPPEISFSVLAFDFRNHGDSGKTEVQFDSQGFLLDAKAAIQFGKSLPGIDPSRIITMGASIGADAAVDACLVLDHFSISENQENQGCIGAISFSPGNYLKINYSAAVQRLENDPFHIKVLCIAAENDYESPSTCKSAGGDHYQYQIYPGSEHGIGLIKAGLDPEIFIVVEDFLLRIISIQD